MYLQLSTSKRLLSTAQKFATEFATNYGRLGVIRAQSK